MQWIYRRYCTFVFFLWEFSFTDTDDSQDSRGREGTNFCSTRSRTFRQLFATLHVRWLSHIFNRNACIYQTATRWNFTTLSNYHFIDWWCEVSYPLLHFLTPCPRPIPPPHPPFLLMFMVQNFMQIRNYIKTWSEKQQKSGHWSLKFCNFYSFFGHQNSSKLAFHMFRNWKPGFIALFLNMLIFQRLFKGMHLTSMSIYCASIWRNRQSHMFYEISVL